MAAAAQFALNHHRDRLIEDHMMAQHLADGLANMPGIRLDATRVQTNIIRFQVTAMPALDLVAGCRSHGLLLSSSGGDQVRAVTHGDLSMENIKSALSIINKQLQHRH